MAKKEKKPKEAEGETPEVAEGAEGEAPAKKKLPLKKQGGSQGWPTTSTFLGSFPVEITCLSERPASPPSQS